MRYITCRIPGSHPIAVEVVNGELVFQHHEVGDSLWCPPGTSLAAWCDDYWDGHPPPGRDWSAMTVVRCPDDPAENIVVVPEPEAWIIYVVIGLIVFFFSTVGIIK